MRPTGDSTGPRVLTGTVTAGVEHGCLMLGRYQLVGGSRGLLRPGARVRVTGRPQPGLVTTGQQGVPFRVTDVEPLP